MWHHANASFIVMLSTIPVLVVGCGSANESPDYGPREASSTTAPVPTANMSDVKSTSADVLRKQIRNASLELQSEKPAESITKIEDLTTSMGGYISSKDSFSRSDHYQVTMLLRVPNEHLEALLKGIREAVSTVVHETVNTQEVTEQYVDLSARLQSLKLTEQEIQKLMEDSRARKAGVDEIMSIHARLTDIRSQVESLEGKLNVLTRQTDMASVTISMSLKEVAVPIVNERWHPRETLHASVRFLIRALQVVANVMIVLFINILPLVIILGLPIWGCAKFARKMIQPRGT